MELVLGIVSAILGLLLVAAVAAGGVFYGRSSADERFILDLKRRERRRERKLNLLLAKLAEKAGLGPFTPRKTSTEPPEPGKPRPRVVPVSESVQRTIARDNQYTDQYPNSTRPPSQVPVPAEVAGAFLADVHAARNGNGRSNHADTTKGE